MKKDSKEKSAILEEDKPQEDINIFVPVDAVDIRGRRLETLYEIEKRCSRKKAQ